MRVSQSNAVGHSNIRHPVTKSISYSINIQYKVKQENIGSSEITLCIRLWTITYGKQDYGKERVIRGWDNVREGKVLCDGQVSDHAI